MTSQDQQSGLYYVSQYTESVKMTSGDASQHPPTQLQNLGNMQTVASMGCTARNEENHSSSSIKMARFPENDSIKHLLSCDSSIHDSVNMKNSAETKVKENTSHVTSLVPDVAAAIEDLLEQTSKVSVDVSVVMLKGWEIFLHVLSGFYY